MMSFTSLSFAGAPIACLIIGTLFFTGCEYYLKRTIDFFAWQYFTIAMGFSVAANGLYLFVIKEYGLASAFVISSAALCIATVLLGIFVFGESWSHTKSVALLLLIISTILLALPEPDTSTTLVATKGDGI